MANITQNEMKSLSSLFAKMDREDLNRAINLHNIRSRRIIAESAAQFSIGDSVQFTSGSRLITGIVEKVNRKTINISTHTQKWRVSPSLLKLVS